MARQKTYVKQDVIINACEVFRKCGYASTSISDLVDGTGLNRKILYDEFYDKAGVFDSALRYYIDITVEAWKTHLTRLPLGFGNIEALFQHTAMTMDQRGSLIVLVISENFHSPESAVERCKMTLELLSDLISRNLLGSCTPARAKELAETLTFQYAALSTRARISAEPNQLANFAEQLLAGVRLSYLHAQELTLSERQQQGLKNNKN